MTKFTDAHRAAIDDFIDTACGPAAPISPLGDLDNPIHPLFQQANFKNWNGKKPTGGRKSKPLSDAAYTAILPALRLASLLITESKMLAPFDHVANGNICSDEDGPYIANGVLTGTPSGLTSTRSLIEMLSNRIVFAFMEDFDQGSAFASTGWSSVHVGPPDKPTPDGGRRTVSVGDAVIKFKQPGWLRYLEHEMAHDTPTHQLNALWDFSMIIMHEVMHAFSMFTGGEEAVKNPEPRLYREEKWQELGWSYTKWVLGQVYIKSSMHRSPWDSDEPGGSCDVKAEENPDNSLDMKAETNPEDNSDIKAKENLDRSSDLKAEANPHDSSDTNPKETKDDSPNITTKITLDSTPAIKMENFGPISRFAGIKVKVRPTDPTEIDQDFDDKTILMTSRATRAWFLKSVWDRIRNEGHQFWIKEANRTEMKYMWGKGKVGQRVFFGVKLMYDGDVYKRMNMRKAVEDKGFLVVKKEEPGAEAWEALEGP